MMRGKQCPLKRMVRRQALLAVFACRNATVHEEAMLAAGALTYACGPQFVKYMERFFPVLQMGLTNHQARPPPPPAALAMTRRSVMVCAILKHGPCH